MRHRLSAAALSLLCALNMNMACGSPPPPGAPASAGTPPAAQAPEGDTSELRKQINSFAEGEGNEAVLRNLKARPQAPLIDAIKRIRDDAPPSDPIRVKIAFLFCRLGYAYPENRAVVLEGFKNPDTYEGFYADDAVGMMASLIRAGDKDLLPAAFAASRRADGALAESLSALYLENLRENPTAFLRRLSPMDSDIRRSVYKQTSFAISTADELDRIKALLSSVPREAKEYPTAKELALFLDKRSVE